ncbi:MAG: hypothetical protein ACOX3Q_12055 [Clostridia bacterium]|jgi:hypothetical protein
MITTGKEKEKMQRKQGAKIMLGLIIVFSMFLLITSCTQEISDENLPIETKAPESTPAQTEETTAREEGEAVESSASEPVPVKYEDAVPYIPTPDDKPIIENLGSFTKTVYIRMNDGGYYKDGTPVLYFVTDGNPYAKFVIANAATGEILREFDLEYSTGAWEVFVHSSENVYISGHGKPYFYIYNRDKDEIENIGPLPAGSGMGQVMCEGENGIVYSGSTDSPTYWGYDPNKKELFAMPALIDNATRYFATAYDPVDKKLYVSVLSKDSKNYLFRVDPVTFEKKDITPEEYRDAVKYNFYDMDIYGDILAIRYPNTYEMIFFDIRKEETVEFKDELTGSSYKVIKTNCRQGAADPEDPTKFYTVIADRLVLFDTVSRTYSTTRTMANAHTRMVFLKLGEKYEGWSACSMFGGSGKIQFSNLQTGINYTRDTNVSGQPNEPNCLTVSKSGILCIGGGYGGSTGFFDIKTGESALFNALNQQEGMTAYDNMIYYGTYPNATIHYGPASVKLWMSKTVLNMGSSSEIPDYELQDRPYTFLSIPEENLVAICTVPAQNSYTGAMALIQASTNTVKKHIAFPVKYQSGVSMAYKDGIIYIGTTSRAGYGTDAKAWEAKLLAYDIAQDTFTEYELPMRNVAAITALTIAGDGNLWGFAYNYLFCFDTEKREFIAYKQQDILCNNQTWREFKLTPGDENCIFASCAYTKTLYYVSLQDMKAYPIAENVGWGHVTDNYGNFYLLNGINVYKVSFKQ